MARSLTVAPMGTTTLAPARGTRERTAIESISVSVADGADRQEIYKIRHEVYSQELHQHAGNAATSLRDGLDESNIYIATKIGGRIAGFVSITPPQAATYSIDKYFARDSLGFPVDGGLYEIRLLTVLKNYRGSDLATLLMYAAFRWVESHGGSHI